MEQIFRAEKSGSIPQYIPNTHYVESPHFFFFLGGGGGEVWIAKLIKNREKKPEPSFVKFYQ